MSDPRLELDYAPDRSQTAWCITATVAMVVAIGMLITALVIEAS